MSKLTELRWRLSEWLFRLSYRVCPDHKAMDFVMRHGVEITKECARLRALEDKGEGR